MGFCQGCETKVQEGGNYCHSCGVGEESFQNGRPEKKLLQIITVHFVHLFEHVFFCPLSFIDPKREIIKHYFHVGYKYDVIISFMRSRHDIYA